MSSQMGFLARSLFVLASLAGACSPDHPSNPPDSSGMQTMPGVQHNSIRVAMVPGQMPSADPVTLEWVDDQGVTSFRTISNATAVEIADVVTELRAKVPSGYTVVGWNSPCVVGLNQPLNNFEVCELPSGAVRNQAFTVWVAPLSYKGWNLNWVHGPITYYTQKGYQTLTALSIDNQGAVAVAGHFGGGFMPFILQGQMNAGGARDWTALYKATSTAGPFLLPIQSLQLLGSVAAPGLTNCRALALLEENGARNKELDCISPQGTTRVVGPYEAPTSTLVVANAATTPTVFTTNGTSIYANSSPELLPANWAKIDLRASLAGLPPLNFIAGSVVGNTPWYVGTDGAHGVLVYPDRDGKWAIDYLALQNDSLVDVQALTGGGAWLLSRNGQMFEKRANSTSYEDRTARTCGYPVSLVAKESSQVWYAGTTGICHWNVAIGEWEPMFWDFGAFAPMQLVMSSDGSWLAAIWSGNLVMTKKIK